jgi:hypothetical protein
MAEPSQPWKSGEIITATRLEAMRSSAITDVRVGAGMTIQRIGNSVVIGRAPVNQIVSQMVWVKVTGAASGGGKYNGKIFTAPTTTPAATGNLAESDIGVLPTSDDCLIFNTPEIGKSTHDLTNGTPVISVFPGAMRGSTTDGLPVVVIYAIDIEACT